MKKCFFVILMLFNLEALAGIDNELEGFFNKMGYSTNASGSGAYESQSGGYYQGGRLYARAPSRSIQFANLQAPSFNAGCGGIDLYMGGMSFIDRENFVKMFRNISTGVVGYGLNLAAQTMTPQVYNTVQKLQDIAREINDMNISSCEAAANVVGGVWPRNDASSRYLCNAMGTNNKSFFSDYASSRQGCGAEGKRDEVNKSKNGEFKELLGDEFNLVWKAIRKNSFLSSDKELAELFMSISGTIISKKVGSGVNARFSQTHLASLVNDQDLIDLILYGVSKTGNTAKIYRCDTDSEDRCLSPSSGIISLGNKEKALVIRVENILRNLAKKAREYDATGYTAEEKGLIESTKIPVLKIITVQNAFRNGSSLINVTEFSEGVAYDLLLQFMEQVLDVVNESLKELEKVQIDGTMIADFKEDIREARKVLIERRNGVYQQMHTMLSVIQTTKLAEGQLQHMFSSYNNVEE